MCAPTAGGAPRSSQPYSSARGTPRHVVYSQGRAFGRLHDGDTVRAFWLARRWTPPNGSDDSSTRPRRSVDVGMRRCVSRLLVIHRRAPTDDQAAQLPSPLGLAASNNGGQADHPGRLTPAIPGRVPRAARRQPRRRRASCRSGRSTAR